MAKSIFIIVLTCCTYNLIAQDSLCVFNVKGPVYSQMDKIIKPLSKGMFINNQSSVLINTGSTLVAINDNGDAYQLDSQGTYNYRNILKLKSSNNTDGLTSKYFKLIWKELIGQKADKTIIGGVFRGDFLMQYPADSSAFASSKLTFQWKTEKDIAEYFLFVKNIETNDIIKIGTNGSAITLYQEHSIFAEGASFQWAVTATEFPNLDNIPFFSFDLIDRNEYHKRISAYHSLSSNLKKLGLSNFEIEKSICETYGICK